MIIGNLNVSNTSGKNGRPDRVTVRRAGAVLACVSFRKRNPLGYMRKWSNSIYTQDLLQQLRAADVNEDEIDLLLDGRKAKTGPTPPTDILSQCWFGLVKV